MSTKHFSRLPSTASIAFALQHSFSTFSPPKLSHPFLSATRCATQAPSSQPQSSPPPPAPTPTIPSLPSFPPPPQSLSHPNLLLLTSSRPRRVAADEHARLTNLTLAHAAPHARHAVLGVDEVGLGSLAGPVVAAAVAFSSSAPLLEGLGDSKAVPPQRRLELAARIIDLAQRGEAKIGLGAASVEEVDFWNVRVARRLAAERAVDDVLCRGVECVLVDGDDVGIRAAREAEMRFVPGGDGLCESVAAASIVAKVVRDAIMKELGERVEGYGIERNAGYGSKEHLTAIRELGAVPGLHRWSFKPVREAFVNEVYVV